MSTIPMHMCTMDHSAYIILTTATVVLRVVVESAAQHRDKNLGFEIETSIEESALN